MSIYWKKVCIYSFFFNLKIDFKTFFGKSQENQKSTILSNFVTVDKIVDKNLLYI